MGAGPGPAGGPAGAGGGGGGGGGPPAGGGGGGGGGRGGGVSGRGGGGRWGVEAAGTTLTPVSAAKRWRRTPGRATAPSSAVGAGRDHVPLRGNQGGPRGAGEAVSR